jgi:hypothetical protein
VQSRAKNWIIIVSLLFWQLGALASAAPFNAVTSSSAELPCHEMDMAATAAIDSKPTSKLPPCCVTHDCQGDCLHSPALTIPVVLIPQCVRNHSRVSALRETVVETQVAEFFRPPI